MTRNLGNSIKSISVGGKPRKYAVSGKVFPNELIYETETDSKPERTDLWLPRGGRVGGGEWIGTVQVKGLTV